MKITSIFLVGLVSLSCAVVAHAESYRGFDVPGSKDAAALNVIFSRKQTVSKSSGEAYIECFRSGYRKQYWGDVKPAPVGQVLDLTSFPCLGNAVSFSPATIDFFHYSAFRGNTSQVFDMTCPKGGAIHVKEWEYDTDGNAQLKYLVFVYDRAGNLFQTELWISAKAASFGTNFSFGGHNMTEDGPAKCPGEKSPYQENFSLETYSLKN